MGVKLSSQESELYKRCDEVLFYLWDPIGVSDQPYARDEYHSYLPQAFQLVRSNATADQIASYLAGVEKDRMGSESQPDHNRKVAEILLEWRRRIFEDAA